METKVAMEPMAHGGGGRGDISAHDWGNVKVLPKVRSKSARKQRCVYLSWTVSTGILQGGGWARPVTSLKVCPSVRSKHE